MIGGSVLRHTDHRVEPRELLQLIECLVARVDDSALTTSMLTTSGLATAADSATAGCSKSAD